MSITIVSLGLVEFHMNGKFVPDFQACFWDSALSFKGLPSWCSGKEPACQCRGWKRCGLDPWVGRIPWKRKQKLILVFMPEKSHGHRSLAGYSPWGCKELDTNECVHVHTHTHTYTHTHIIHKGFPGGTSGKEPAWQCRRHKRWGVWSLGWEDLLEEGMVTHFSILAWKIPWKQEPGRLQSMGLQRARHNWVGCAPI